MRTPACSIRGVLTEMRQIHMDYRVLWRKRDSTATQGESAPTLALIGFYCFSGHITLRKVLIYEVQVRFRWLHFTENKGDDVANYIKKRRIFANVKGKVVELVTLILGRFSIDFRKLL